MKRKNHPSKKMNDDDVQTSAYPLIIRQKFQSGDIGHLIFLHGTVYAKEYGYDHTFEAYVANGLADFLQSYDPMRERFWLVEIKNQLVGFLAIVSRSKREAQLHWFFVHPDYRGRGIGKMLLTQALFFCRNHKYRSISLWTTSELAIAHHLYTAAGFRKTEEKTHFLWGKTVCEERYELHL